MYVITQKDMRKNKIIIIERETLKDVIVFLESRIQGTHGVFRYMVVSIVYV